LDRVFLPRDMLVKGHFVVNGSERRHLADALRVRRGERFLATDGEGREYLLEAETVAKRELVAAVVEERTRPAGAGALLTLAIAPPKGSRMETALEKATECGVGRVVPIVASRSVVKTRDESERLERWRRVVRSAAAQSGRYRTPVVGSVTPFSDAIGVEGRVLLAHPGEDAVPLERALFGVGPGTPVTILVGPEGGFSGREAKEARRAGAAAVSLGKNRLRTETAAIVAVALAIAVLGGQEV
jgi:16S rRNA (uracil1498-N3)-methyltransferase